MGSLLAIAPSADAPRDVAQLELIYMLDPRVVERAKRLDFALRRIRQGMTAFQVRAALRQHFGIQQPLAWKIVDMALDLAGPV